MNPPEPGCPACSVWAAHPSWHRIERARDAQGRLQLLGAAQPSLGRPRAWLLAPLRWLGGDRFERMDGPLLKLPLQPETPGGLPAAPGRPQRLSLEPALLPAEQAEDAAAFAQAGGAGRAGLLCLLLYLDPRHGAREGSNGAVLAGHLEPDAQDLTLALEEQLRRPPAEWAHAWVPSEERPARGPTSLLLAACQYPPGLLDMSRGAGRRPAQASPAEASMARMVAFCRGHARGAEASLLLLAGDAIYADASAGLADPQNSTERYARPYQQLKAGLIRELPPTLARIVHAPDDHEIEDNWEPVFKPADRRQVLRGDYVEAAAQTAWDYRWEPGAREGLGRHFWHRFDWQGARVFVADSRLEREPRDARNWREAQMLGTAQRAAISAWLAEAGAAPRLLLCGALPLPRRLATAEQPASALRSDAWDGYPASLHWLLGEVWRQRAAGLVLLSGDEHRSGFVSATLEAVDGSGEPLRLHSIHSSALHAPWPFSVTAAEEFAAPECFEFDSPQGPRLRCRVGAWSDHPGDGFALLRIEPGAAAEPGAARSQVLRLWFDRADAPLHAEPAGLREPDGCLPLG